MNRTLVDRIADAILYEGYILYPYRPSVKNHQRWTFGGLCPEAYCQARGTGDSSSNQTEILVHGGAETVIEVVVRFLHLTDRRVGEFVLSSVEWRPVDVLRVGEMVYRPWQEAELREVVLDNMTLRELVNQPKRQGFAFPGGQRTQSLPGPDGKTVGALIREQQKVEGLVEVAAVEVDPGLFRLRVRIENRTAFGNAGRCSRDEAMLHALVSTHTILGVQQGAFVSLLEPPKGLQEMAAACRNVGTWPVLIGTDGQTDTMLSSPIILYDYPQVAPESPGDFFDGTEIDEMLTLRVLTLTDDEKREMASVDERAGDLLARTEAMAREQLMRLHGTVRTR